MYITRSLRSCILICILSSVVLGGLLSNAHTTYASVRHLVHAASRNNNLSPIWSTDNDPAPTGPLAAMSPARRYECTFRVIKGLGLALGIGVNIPVNNPQGAQLYWVIQLAAAFNTGLTGNFSVTASKDSGRAVATQANIGRLNLGKETYRAGDFLVYPGPAPVGDAAHYPFTGYGKIFTSDQIANLPDIFSGTSIWLNDDSLAPNPNLLPFELQAAVAKSSDTSLTFAGSNLVAASTLTLPAPTPNIDAMKKLMIAAQLSFQLAQGRVGGGVLPERPDDSELIQESVDFQNALSNNPFSAADQVQIDAGALTAWANAVGVPQAIAAGIAISTAIGAFLKNVFEAGTAAKKFFDGIGVFLELVGIEWFNFQTAQIVEPGSMDVVSGETNDTGGGCDATSDSSSCVAQNLSGCTDIQDNSSLCTTSFSDIGSDNTLIA